jgi:hypothetical protein
MMMCRAFATLQVIDSPMNASARVCWSRAAMRCTSSCTSLDSAAIAEPIRSYLHASPHCTQPGFTKSMNSRLDLLCS